MLSFALSSKSSFTRWYHLFLPCSLGNVVLIEVFVSGIVSAHILYLDACRLDSLKSLPSRRVVVEESPNGVDAFLVEIGNGSMDITHGVQNDGRRNGFFPFHRKKRKKIYKALKDAVRSIIRFSCYHGNILRSDCALECLVVPKFIPSCSIGKADGRILSSSYLVANMTEIGT